MGRRREGREAALQMLYQIEISGQSADECADTYWTTRKDPGDEVRLHAEALARQASADRESIDGLIDSAASNWHLKRIARLDLSILRVAVCELIHFPATPAEVVIDEAVEIARRFSDEESASFINGILDRVARDRGLIEGRS